MQTYSERPRLRRCLKTTLALSELYHMAHMVQPNPLKRHRLAEVLPRDRDDRQGRDSTSHSNQAQVDSAKSTSCKGIWAPTPPAPSKSTQTPAAGVFDGQNPIPVHPTHERYNTQTIRELGKYFLHDHAVRESGHDTTYRLEKRCANLGPIDLQSLLYKYELNIATAIHEVFDDELELDECCDLAPSPVTRSVEADASTRLPTNRIGVFLLEIDC
ncbi:hypothetical protein EDB83DRAFT_1990157 [Lactarius deliciosus]|nr:hypothetical protein EDB83DRAFT_1990157 [Lactarius deliciosus]